MARIVVFSLCLLLTIRSITCINCYHCISSENPDCLQPENRVPLKMCDLDSLLKTKDYAISLNNSFKRIFEFTTIEKSIPLNCLKVVVMVGGKEVVFRGCQLPTDTQNQLDVCKKIYDNQSRNDVRVSGCSLCDTDACNSARLARPTSLAASSALLLYVLAKAF